MFDIMYVTQLVCFGTLCLVLLSFDTIVIIILLLYYTISCVIITDGFFGRPLFQ